MPQSAALGPSGFPGSEETIMTGGRNVRMVSEAAFRRTRRKPWSLLGGFALLAMVLVPIAGFLHGTAQVKASVRATLVQAADSLSDLLRREPGLWTERPDDLHAWMAFHSTDSGLHRVLYGPEGSIIYAGGPSGLWPRLQLETPVSDGRGAVGRLAATAGLGSVLWSSLAIFVGGIGVSMVLLVLTRTFLLRLMEENARLRTHELEDRNQGLGRALRALREATVSKAHLDRILSSLFEGVVVVGADGRIRQVNAAGAVLFGYPVEGSVMVGMPFRHLVMGCDPTPPTAADGPPASGIFLTSCEAQVLHRSGTLVPVLLSGAALREPGGAGEPVFVYSVWDIADRKRAEADVEASGRKLNELLESITDGFCSYDRFWRCTYVNDNMLRILDRTRAQVLFRPIWQQFPQLRGTGFVASILQTALRGRKAVMEYQCEQTDRWWSYAVNPYQDGFSVIVQDITVRKAAEAQIERLNLELEGRVAARTEELRVAQAELIRKNRLAVLGQLTATVSHELRNPLGAIANSLYVLKQGLDPDDPRLPRAVDRIERCVGRCDRIVDEMLEYARSRPLRLERTRLGPWLHEIIGELTLPPGVQVVVETEPPAASARIDRDAMRRAVLNLLENAAQAMAPAAPHDASVPAAELVVRCRRDGDTVAVTIEDCGCGIPEAVLPKIFEPLFSTKSFGVGLGLPIVKRILDSHGGSVTLRNREDCSGVSARMCFPADPESGGGQQTEEAA